MNILNKNTEKYWDNIWENSEQQRIRIYPNIFSQIVSWIKPNSKVLDIGCGVGNLLEVIKRKNCDVVGLEFSSSAIDVLTEKGIKGIKATLPDIPVDDFDYVIATEVLEHIDDDKALIKRMFEVAKEVIIAVPDNCLGEVEDHIRTYTERKLVKKLKKFAKYIEVVKLTDLGHPRLVIRASNEPIEKQIKVYVCIPNTWNIHPSLHYYLRTLEDDPRYFVKTRTPARKTIDNNRNLIVREFLESGYDYLLMIDSDIIPTRNVLDLVELDKDIIGCPCPQWHETDMYWVVMDEVEGGYKAVPVEKRGGLKEVDALGTGCILISRRVLEKIKAPFERLWSEDGVQELGQDFYFCQKAKKKGFKVWAHWDYPCSHWVRIDLLNVAKLLSKNG